MTTFPFFSICLPTKNRAWLVPTAVESLMRQTFPDFEVIVADNDDGDDTAKALRIFDDPRIRHVRTGGLSMPDNWDAAAAVAQGEYLCFLEDKQTYKFDSLERIHALAETHRADALRWQSEALVTCPGGGTRVRRARRGPAARLLDTDEILESFTQQSYSIGKRLLPLGHFSAVKRTLADRIRSSPTGRLCPPMSPDYTMAFCQLALTDQILVTSEAFVVFSTVSVSNGINTRLKKGGVAALARELGKTQHEFYDRVPIKTVTVSNGIFNDYLHLQSQLGGRLAAHPLNWRNYFCECFASIGASAKLGVDVAEELAHWEQAFTSQPEDVQRDVMTTLHADTPAARRQALAVHYAPPGALAVGLDWAKSMTRRHVLRRRDWRYSNVLDYLAREYQERTGRKPTPTLEPRRT